MMSAMSTDFKITPPKVKPHRGISWVRLVFILLVCVVGPSIVPFIVYLLEGCTDIFFWMLGFGSLTSILLLIFNLGKFKDIIQYFKIRCCKATSRRKLLRIPSHYKNLSPLKRDSTAKNSARQILEDFDLSQSTATTTTVEMPISLDCLSSNSLPDELHVVDISQQLAILTPTKRRKVSAASISLSPLRNETKTSEKISPFSKRRSEFPGCVSPRHLGHNAKNLSTIFESPYPDGNVDNLPSRRLSCYSS